MYRFIRNLRDVLIRDPQEGDGLVYDGTARKWRNGSGGSSALTVLGPFPFAFDSPDIETTGLVLTPIPAGSMLVKAWAIARAGWTWGSTGEVQLTLGSVADRLGDEGVIVNYKSGSPGNNPTVYSREMNLTGTGSPSFQQFAVNCIDASLLAVYVVPDSTADSGEADAYALIWTPE